MYSFIISVTEPCSVDEEFHYSWDFAQQVHYPHHSHQVGPIFFKTPRKCAVFGVCAEGTGKRLPTDFINLACSWASMASNNILKHVAYT